MMIYYNLGLGRLSIKPFNLKKKSIKMNKTAAFYDTTRSAAYCLFWYNK
jgi:hypothetical protein